MLISCYNFYKRTFFKNFLFQAMAEDEISFDPNDIITNIEMVRMD